MLCGAKKLHCILVLVIVEFTRLGFYVKRCSILYLFFGKSQAHVCLIASACFNTLPIRARRFVFLTMSIHLKQSSEACIFDGWE